jgi:hypothetical protein
VLGLVDLSRIVLNIIRRWLPSGKQVRPVMSEFTRYIPATPPNMGHFGTTNDPHSNWVFVALGLVAPAASFVVAFLPYRKLLR